ncbi:unnamed protein product [Paramecium octaurelia]|uniref:Uncharacterized protein n=1 Tax=Paramecium octaurelia TaxID=43137 RepID=A0A8S1WES4_PAROT|nr:unnamed protein product [Paramecium octaurelia]
MINIQLKCLSIHNLTEITFEPGIVIIILLGDQILLQNRFLQLFQNLNNLEAYSQIIFNQIQFYRSLYSKKYKPKIQ